MIHVCDNKNRLFPCTAITGWSFDGHEFVLFEVGTEPLYITLFNVNIQLFAVALGVSRRLVLVEIRFQSRVVPCEFYGGHSDMGQF